jgi:hypothetical protein
MTTPEPNRWPAAVIALAVVFLIGLTASLYWGITRASRVTDPAYYSRGVTYNSELRARQTAERLWRLSVSQTGNVLVLRLTGDGGAPVLGAAGTVTLLAADGTPERELTLSPGESGEYRTPLAVLPAAGQKAWAELRLGDNLLRRSLLLVP